MAFSKRETPHPMMGGAHGMRTHVRHRVGLGGTQGDAGNWWGRSAGHRGVTSNRGQFDPSDPDAAGSGWGGGTFAILLKIELGGHGLSRGVGMWELRTQSTSKRIGRHLDAVRLRSLVR